MSERGDTSVAASARPQPRDVVLPTQDDPFVRASSDGVGGVAGRRVHPDSGWWTTARVLVAMTLLVVGFGVLTKAPCHGAAWPRDGRFEYVHACYSDVPYLYRERGLADGSVPYLEATVEYPVLTGALMGVSAPLARWSADGAEDQSRRFYDVTAFFLAGLAVVTVLGVAALAGRRRWDAALVALAPVLALSATINWDLLAVALVTMSLLAWARLRPTLAGALLGLAVAAKFYPLLVLGPLFLLAVRAGRLRAFSRTAVTAVLAWALVNVPVAVLAPRAWVEFYTFSEDREASFGSPWYWMVQTVAPVSASTVNLLGTGTFVLLAVAIAVLAFTAPRRPRLVCLVFLTVAAFCLTNKVYSPQFALWLLPLAALARPRWRDLLIWQACEVVYFFAIWLHLASFEDTKYGLPQTAYWLALWLHVAGTVYLAVMVVRDVWRPEHDPVRVDGVDDPSGGVLAGAGDRLAVRPSGSR